MVKSKKSAGFDRSMNPVIKAKIISENIETIGEMAMKVANRIAPIQDGFLRGSLYEEKSFMKYMGTWRIDYARKRYHVNDKNPQTREWARKAHEQNAGLFYTIAGRGL